MSKITVDTADLALIIRENVDLKKRVDELLGSNTDYLEAKREAKRVLSDLAQAAALVIAEWDLNKVELQDAQLLDLRDDVERLRERLTSHMPTIERCEEPGRAREKHGDEAMSEASEKTPRRGGAHEIARDAQAAEALRALADEVERGEVLGHFSVALLKNAEILHFLGDVGECMPSKLFVALQWLAERAKNRMYENLDDAVSDALGKAVK